jgi:endonuclease G
MKQKLLLSLLIIFLSFTDVFSQLRDSVLVETPIFTVMYSETKEQPLWAEYVILCPAGGVDRHGLNFWKPDDVHTSDDNDYRNTVWDKGHLAPAAAFNCDREMLRSTFTYVNSVLQHQGLNRGAWARLELFERALANFHTVKVRIDVLFEEMVVQSNGATLPTGFRKVIWYDGNRIEFVFPNEDTTGRDFVEFLVK